MATNTEQVIESIAKEYGPKIIALLTRIGTICRDAGFNTDEPYDFSDDTFRWSLVVWHGERVDNNMIDFTIEISEAQQYGDEPEDGITFGLMIVEYGGRIVGQMTPYNYTPQCWVSAHDASAVAERWQIMEEADLSTIPQLLEGN